MDKEGSTLSDWCIFSEHLSPEVAKMLCPLVVIRIGSKIFEGDKDKLRSVS